MSIQQLDQPVNRFGTTKVGDFLNNHTSPDGSQLIDDLTPTGTIEITENGEYDVTQYASADVNVEGITVNESYDISEGTLNGATYTIESGVTAHIPDGVTAIGKEAFKDDEIIRSVIIPDGVTSISDSVFNHCTSLTSITIPDGVTSIGDGAFNGCTSLTSITIPNSVTSIGDNAFIGCTSLTDIYYTGTQEEWEAIAGIRIAEIPEGATIHYEYTPE